MKRADGDAQPSRRCDHSDTLSCLRNKAEELAWLGIENDQLLLIIRTAWWEKGIEAARLADIFRATMIGQRCSNSTSACTTANRRCAAQGAPNQYSLINHQ
jgi:hypothetical protein